MSVNKKNINIKPIRTLESNLREDIFTLIFNYLGKDYILMMECDFFGGRISGDSHFDKLASCINLKRDYLDICLKNYMVVEMYSQTVKFRILPYKIDIEPTTRYFLKCKFLSGK